MDNNPYESSASIAKTNDESKQQDPARIDSELWEIKRDANNALVLGWCGLLLCLPYFCSPIAIYLGNRALKNINKFNKGHEHERTAKRAVGLGKTALILLATIFVVVAAIAVYSSVAGP